MADTALAVRFSNDQCEVGTLNPPGPNDDHVLELKQLDGPFYEVVGEAHAISSGPAQVASDAYRRGWARIFGGEPAVGEA